MKKLFLSIVAVLVSALTLSAQEATYALIDMQYITSKIPAYTSANDQIKKSSEAWGKEISALQEQAKKLYIDYQQTQDKLTAQQKVAKENAIVKVEDEAQKLQMKYFGQYGEMAKLQEKLIKPITDKIYEAVKVVSEHRGYYMVFDRATAQGVIIYADPQADISNDVLAVLGFSNK